MLRSHAVALALALSLFGCKERKPETTNAWDPPASGSAKPSTTPSSTAQAAASAILASAADGAAFAPFFPAAGDDGTTDKVNRAPKQGSAEVLYKKGNYEVVTILISDTAAAPAVRDDYKSATEKAGGYPLKTSGQNKSAALVADRFEVTVSSPRLKPEQRKVWIEKVDLKGLAKLAK